MPKQGIQFHFILNSYSEPLEFELPPLRADKWRRWIDTGLESPDDISSWDQATYVSDFTYSAKDHSVVMLFAKGDR